MPRHREPSPYQLPLELVPRPLPETAVYRAILQQFADEDRLRFVQAVREEVVVHSPADAAHYLQTQVFAPFDHLDQEELWLLLLSARQRITHTVMLYRGTLDSIPIRPSEVFKEPIRINAAGVILAHNHPSGDASPSTQDVQLTETLIVLGELLQLPVLDHLVIGRQTWTSLRAQGLAFYPGVLR